MYTRQEMEILIAYYRPKLIGKRLYPKKNGNLIIDLLVDGNEDSLQLKAASLVDGKQSVSRAIGSVAYDYGLTVPAVVLRNSKNQRI
jgi:hypothetical protein